MKETLPLKPIFTRRRVLAAASAVLILAVGVLFIAVLREESSVLLKMTFLRFDEARDSTLGMVAVVRLENKSKATIHLLSVLSVYGQTVWGEVLSTGNTNYAETFSTSSFITLEPFALSTNRVLLPMNGAAGRLSVSGFVMPRIRTGLLGRVQQLWWQVRGPETLVVQSICDQEIQCPRVLPDGTVEPPRLLDQATRQR